MGDPLDRASDPRHFRRTRDQPAQNLSIGGRAVGQSRIFLLQRMDVEGAAHDQPQLVDVDGLLVKVISPAGDRLQRAVARAMARSDDDLGIRLDPQHVGQRHDVDDHDD